MSEVATMLDTLLMSKYSKELLANGFSTFHTMLASEEWKKLIKNGRDRNIIEGFLSTRSEKTGSQRDLINQQKVELLRSLKASLVEVQNLHLRKLELERRRPPQSSTHRNDIDNVLDKIDEEKEKIKANECFLTELTKGTKKTGSSRRGKSAMQSPRLANESPKRRPSTATAKAADPPQRPPSSQCCDGCFADVMFNRPLSSSANFFRASSSNEDLGHGWNRRAPVGSRVSYLYSKKQYGGQKSFPAESFAVRGIRASGGALGINIENDHYAQMCCGAIVQ
jgi:hypothetical protein